MNSPFLRIGHRGACGYEPENSLRSFKKALTLKVDMIELDVQLCRSGELVVIHDSKVDRTTDGIGSVAKKSLEQLKKLDAGKGGSIPLLPEVLDLVDNRIIVNIELKGKRTAEPVSVLIKKYLHKGWDKDNFLLSSFSREELIDARENSPNLNIGVNITSLKKDTMQFARSLGACSIHPSLQITTKKLVDEIHRQGMKVFVWTVNEEKDIARTKEINVDGCFSDYPDRL
ncbi:MAG: glycerophosphodiester phosphodiesterase [Proteobacteria bacterium]|nr:glycerophosphodiester phosphodiesterase [Pseudomonadota bacterium]